MECDVLIVGAGFAGSVLAERLTSFGKRCIIVDKRDHIGGNAYDYYDASGVLVHKYGPHLFHTNSDRIFEYLSMFTEWIPYQLTGKSFVDGKFWSFPINLETFEQMLGRPSTTDEMTEYLSRVKVPIAHPKNSEEAIVSQVGWELYEKFYKGYVKTHWNREPKDLDASVCLRIPIRTTRNDLFFDDKHQYMPAKGYTDMFRRMVGGIRIILNTDYREMSCQYKHLVYTGPIDEFFDYAHGHLAYRSLRFEHQTFGPEKLKGGFWQPTTVVSYPDGGPLKRIVEIKHATGQACPHSTIVREYPIDSDGREPYYPVPAPDTALMYAKYKAMADKREDVSFVGRLARYQYLNMDQVVGMALKEFENLRITL
jgi:UDP-galactopyranose mutase